MGSNLAEASFPANVAIGLIEFFIFFCFICNNLQLSDFRPVMKLFDLLYPEKEVRTTRYLGNSSPLVGSIVGAVDKRSPPSSVTRFPFSSSHVG